MTNMPMTCAFLTRPDVLALVTELSCEDNGNASRTNQRQDRERLKAQDVAA